MRRVVNGERRSHAPKSRRALSFPISCHYGGDNSSERRSLAALAWFRVAACDLRLGERPGGLLTPLGPLGSTWLNHIAHPLPPIGRRVLVTANSSPGFSFRTASRARLLCLLAGYPEWFKAAPPMRELRGLLATGLKQKRIHGLS